jgi:hypothetical protein
VVGGGSLYRRTSLTWEKRFWSSSQKNHNG